jgi:hypothetical protein
VRLQTGAVERSLALLNGRIDDAEALAIDAFRLLSAPGASSGPLFDGA